MKDWKGNEIEEGDTIMLVSTKSAEINSSLILIDFSHPEKKAEVLSTYKKKANYRWLPTHEYKIIKIGSWLYFTFMENEITCNYGIDILKYSLDDNTILCIKGKSDNETEYYQHYFNS